MKRLRIAAIEPYGALSHLALLDGLRRNSAHDIELRTLPARAWKWRMRTAALHYAETLPREGPWDLLLASDYTNLAELRALWPGSTKGPPAVLYFHENQLTYPLQPGEARDNQFALIHLYAALAAEVVLFNSAFHRASFTQALSDLLALAPDVDLAPALRRLDERSRVLPLGTDVARGEPRRPAPGRAPTVLWNHRWEYDKEPETFVRCLELLAERDVPFRLRVLGQQFRTTPRALSELRTRLGDRVETLGFVPDRAAYLDAVRGADLTVSTARHEFFGLGTLEALRAGLLPVLPADLAYPELLPAGERHAGRFLYERGAEREPERDAHLAAAALAAGLRAVTEDAWLPERRALIEYTETFAWSRLAPRYDRVFEQAAALNP